MKSATGEEGKLQSGTQLRGGDYRLLCASWAVSVVGIGSLIKCGLS